MIQLFNVIKKYGRGSPALDDISLKIEKGEFVFLTGPSGAGKTTILKIIFGWEHFEEGQVLVQGINIGRLDSGNIYTLRRSIGVIFQGYKLLANKTVFENVAFAQEVTNRDRKTIKFKTWEALKNVGLTSQKRFFPGSSFRRRTATCCYCPGNGECPPIILADEPTGNLDQEISLEILKLFEELNRNGATIVFATHSQDILKLGNHRVIVLNRGKVVSS